MVTSRFADVSVRQRPDRQYTKSIRPSGWKYFLSYYFKPVGGKFVVCCNFDLKIMPLNLPNYDKECLECFEECSIANVTNVNNLTHEQSARTVIWNNKFVNIEGKSVFNGKLVRQGIVTVFDLVTKQNRYVGINNNLSPIYMFVLMSIADTLPVNWRQSIKGNNYFSNTVVIFDLQSQIGLYIMRNKVLISKVSSKSISKELRSKVTASPTTQAKYIELFENDNLEWNEIYSLPFKVALDTRTREFQYRLLNSYLATNSFLQKIGKIDLSTCMCSFCNAEAESLEHLFLSCPKINQLWANLIVWCSGKNILIKSLSDDDKLFGIWTRKEDTLILNHLILITKQYIYYCRNSTAKPSFCVLLLKVESIYQLESWINKSNNKLNVHLLKWGKYINS